MPNKTKSSWLELDSENHFYGLNSTLQSIQRPDAPHKGLLKNTCINIEGLLHWPHSSNPPTAYKADARTAQGGLV